MDGVTRNSPGVARARWLAELAVTIDEALLSAWKLGRAGVRPAEAFDVYCQLQAARDEVENLRSGGWRAIRNEIGSN